MRRSTERILTTHAGSLPRPENLTHLFVRRAFGESIDTNEIAAAGRDAVCAIVPKQAEVGIDVGNNGEQQRESFFLYLKERLTGLGGSWQRPSRADVDRYPGFKKRWLEQTSNKTRISLNEGLPTALGEVRYKDAAAIEAECRYFKEVLSTTPNIFAEAFMNAPSPGVLAAAIKNHHYETMSRSKRSGKRCESSMRQSLRRDSCCKSMRQISPSSDIYPSKTNPSSNFSNLPKPWSAKSIALCATWPLIGFASTSVGGIQSRRTIATCLSKI